MCSTTVTALLQPEQIESFHSNGYVVARGLLSADEVALIRDTFMKMNEKGPVEGLSEIRRAHADGKVGYDASDPLSFYPRMIHPHLHDDKPVGPVARRFLLDPRVREILLTLMGEEPFAVQSMFYFKPPGARGQDLHQDNFYLRVKPGTCMAAWMAIDDCDEENGGMMCVPNTAGLDTQCPEKSDPTLYFTTEHVAPPPGTKPEICRMRAGDVLFFNGQTIHGSGPNTSKTRFRRSLICHYVPASTAEMSHWYKAFDFAGRPIPLKVNNDGGPCGTPHEAVKGPH